MLRWLVLLVVSVPMRADLRIVTKQTAGGHTETETEFYKGDLYRTRGKINYIIDVEHRRAIILDPVKREYWEQHWERSGIIHAKSGSEVIEINTRATEEKRSQWGHIAHQFITTRREHFESANGEVTPWTETTIESWFLDYPAPQNYHCPSALKTVAILTTQGRVPEFRVNYSGVKPSGLLVFEKTELSVFEMTELSAGELAPNVFDPPKEYRRVIRPSPGQALTVNERILYLWQEVEDWFTDLFS
jgi:hypothetical protein